MANAKHLKILKQGIKAWNEWREESEAVPDLRNADLNKEYLMGIRFHGTMLGGANLNNANLGYATLSNADLSAANLRHARLVGAKLWDANLRGTDLSHSHLMLAILRGAVLAGTDFSDASMMGTVISGVDLSEARNLDTVKHHGTSSIDIDTIFKSGGNIPESFLRHCGVPQEFRTYMRSLTMRAIEFYSCFISYSSKDDEFARRLYADLHKEGVRCWFAPEDMKIGVPLRVGIDEAVRLHDKLLLVLSKHSVASQWVEKEVETAFEKEKKQKKRVLFPIRLDDAVMRKKTGWAADIKKSRHIGDFREWKNHDSYRKAFERLMRDLKAETGR
ncbi:MAG TPA: toll/interleukin-1 receptor domain-containing protein [Pyrinomonadaceae bacterium]|nr:toll/interleukin-1 receptor domain-containing protein [Pyrinomonadaceae bacterium]